MFKVYKQCCNHVVLQKLDENMDLEGEMTLQKRNVR